VSDLPQGWSVSRLGDCLEVIRGASPRPKGDPRYFGGPISWISIRDINAVNGKYLTKTLEGVTEAGAAKSRLLEPGALILSNSGSVCLPKILKIQGCIHDGFLAFPNLQADFDTDYFYYMFNWMRPSVIAKHRQGMTQVNLNTDIVRNFLIPIAPRKEQTRIAAKLDTVVGKVDKCHERLSRVPQILRQFREAVLEAAVSGRLTEEWRESTDAAEWSPATVDELCSVVFDGPFGSHLKSADYSDSGVRVVRLENIGHLKFLGDRETFVPRAKYLSLEKHALRVGDVMFSSFVDEEVRVCLVPPDLGTAINKADCFCLRIEASKAIPAFVAYRLATVKTYSDLKAMVHGATRPRINLSQLRSYEISLPSRQEQQEIVRRLDELFALAETLHCRYDNAVSRATKLTPSVLGKAFRGELVPQDPNEEPAQKLLARIRESGRDRSRHPPS
jgi:type I restriction enzyme S subunit